MTSLRHPHAVSDKRFDAIPINDLFDIRNYRKATEDAFARRGTPDKPLKIGASSTRLDPKRKFEFES